MCQAIEDGGRRCPVHRRDSIVAIKLASAVSGLSNDVTEDLFSELRLEGRHTVLSGAMADNYSTLVESFDSSIEAMGSERYASILRDRTLDDEPDNATLYALTRLRGAAISRGAALQTAFSQLSTETGVLTTAISTRYNNLRRGFTEGTLIAGDAEWNDQLRSAAYNADLPSDKASVSALTFMRNSYRALVPDSDEPERRVTHEDLTERTHHVILAGGYDEDGGRLELVFSHNPETTYAYHSVPSNVWAEFRESADSPMSVFAHSIRNNPDYSYASRDEAERDATRYRCAACGQFRSAMNHDCPAVSATVDSLTTSPRNSLPAPVSRVEDIPLVPVAAPDVANTFPDPTRPEPDEEEPLSSAAVSEPEDEPEEEVTPEFPAPGSIFTSVTPEVASRLEGEIAHAEEIARLNAQNMSTILDSTVVEDIDENSGTVIVQGFTPEPIVDFSGTNYQVTRSAYSVTGLPEGFELQPRQIIITEREEGNWYYGRFVRVMDGAGLTGNRGHISYIPRAASPYPPVDPANPPRSGYTPPTAWVEHASEAYLSTPNGQLERTYFHQNASRSRVYAPPVVLAAGDEGTAPSVSQSSRWMSTRELRAWHAANDGTVATADIHWEITPQSGFRDGHGNSIHASSGGFTVNGKLGIKRNEAGEMRVATGRHELRCSCTLYRQTYHCSHIDYVHSNGHRMAINMMPAATAARASGTQATAGLFQRSLENRSDFSSRTTEAGNVVGTFSVSRSARNRETINFSSLLTEDQVNPTTLDFDTFNEVSNARNSTMQLPRRSLVNSALTRGDIDIEIGNGYRGTITISDRLNTIPSPYGDGRYQYARSFSVLGIMGVSRGEDGSVVASGDRLRCICGRFVSSEQAGQGTCPHIQQAVEYAQRYYAEGTAAERDPSHSITINSQIREIIENQGFIGETRIHREMSFLENQALSAGTPIPDEATLRATAEVAVADEVRALERAAVEEAERRERRQREREEEERVARLSFQDRAIARQAAEIAERNTFLAENAEFAQDLVAYRADQATKWQEVEPGYGDDITKARSDFEEEKGYRGTDQHLPPLTENVTDGICDPNVPGSRRFGVELEFVFASGTNRSEAIANITREMRDAGLTNQHGMDRYHSARSGGWSRWSLESDCTVDGELVSPILDDSPESWEQMSKALEILKRYGAKTSTKAGSHVHISSGSYVGSIGKHVELMRTIQEHEDVIYRAAADPSKGTHRGMQWCGPNVETPRDVDIHTNFAQDSSTRGMTMRSYMGHQNMMNFEGSGQRDTKAHIEFRMWDSSLDLATIQQQVATSAALTEFADRRIESEGISPGRSGRVRLNVTSGSSEVSDEALLNATALADKIFRKQSDRKRFMAMFAINKWKN